MTDPERSTTILLDRWHGGDRAALDQLLEQHAGWIRSHVHRRLGGALRGRAETGDYVQETVLEFLRYGPRFRLSNGNHFRALLGRIAERVLSGNHRWWQARRRELARERGLPADSAIDLDAARRPTSPTQAAQRSERAQWIRLGLELLPHEQREVLVLRQFDGLGYREIAERLHSTAEAARKRYARAVAELGVLVGRLRRRELDLLLTEEGASG